MNQKRQDAFHQVRNRAPSRCSARLPNRRFFRQTSNSKNARDVDAIEPAGGETLAFTRVTDAEVAAKCDPNVSVTPGERITVAADMSHTRLTGMETDQVVPVAATGA